MVADIEYRIFGPSIEKLQELGDRYRFALKQHPEIIHTQITTPRGEPKLFFDADEIEALLRGLKLAELALQLESSVDGAVGGSIIEDLEKLPVRVRYPDEHRADLESITSTAFTNPALDRWLSTAALREFVLKPEVPHARLILL